jgi:hypothetical protein
MSSKHCKKCAEFKPFTAFRVGRNVCMACLAADSRRYYANNRERCLENRRKCRVKSGGKYLATERRWRANNPDKVKMMDRKHLLKRHYGLSIEQYEAMLLSNEGRCEICRVPFDAARASTKCCVDHCHSSGRVRGLICSDCNVGLGFFKDDPQRLIDAVTYLQRKVG